MGPSDVFALTFRGFAVEKNMETCNTNMLAKSSIEMGLASKPIDTNQDHHKARKQERAKVEDRSASRNLSQEDDNHRESLQQRFAMLTAMLQAMLLALWEVPVATLRAVLCANAVTKAVEEVC